MVPLLSFLFLPPSFFSFSSPFFLFFFFPLLSFLFLPPFPLFPNLSISLVEREIELTSEEFDAPLLPLLCHWFVSPLPPSPLPPSPLLSPSNIPFFLFPFFSFLFLGILVSERVFWLCSKPMSPSLIL